MTDKLKLFKVRLASGAVRAVVAPDFAAVAQLRFDAPPFDAPAPMQDDGILGIDYGHDVDFVILREPLQEGQAVTLTETEAEAANPRLTRCRRCGVRLQYPADGGCTPERCADPNASDEPPRVGSPCPQCGGTLRSNLGQLTCNLGHEVGDAPRDIAGDANRRL